MVTKPWAKLYPEGRHIIYEGDDAEGFADAILIEFGFDVRGDEEWNTPYADWVPDDARHGDRYYGFTCAAEHLDMIYADPRYPLEGD